VQGLNNFGLVGKRSTDGLIVALNALHHFSKVSGQVCLQSRYMRTFEREKETLPCLSHHQ
jgi:hypothetical protein